MVKKYKVVIQKDGDYFIAWCPEVPEANGQGKTKEACIENLEEAIRLVLEDRKERP